MARRQAKVSKQQLHTIKERFKAFLNGNTKIASDEAFYNAVRAYYDIFICSERVLKLVVSGGCSANDFREVFKSIIEKRVRSLPEIHGLSKETVLSAWMAKFDAIYRGEDDPRKGTSRIAASAASELILSKEQLYEMFQTILGIKKYEHQILYNACQLDNADEQAACIRRELQRKMTNIPEQRKRLPPFLIKDMEALYVEEQQAEINQLMGALESLPVAKGSSESKYSLYRLKKVQNSISVVDVPDDTDPTLSKSDIVLSFTIEVVVSEARGLKQLPAKKIVYCTMEVEGGEKLQTGQAEAGKPVWDTQGDFTTCHARPIIKIKLFAENLGIMALDDKELGRLIIKPVPGGSDVFEWHALTAPKGWTGGKLELKVAVKMDKPLNLKKSGMLFAHGKTLWKKWKKRFFVLVQVSQYTFAMCSYMEKKSEPSDMMQLDGYTVDYCEKIEGEEFKGGRFFFKAVKEGDQMIFATDEELERTVWVNKLYMATGQSHKPVAPKLSMVATALESSSTLSRVQGAADRAKKHGFDDLIQADPSKFDHHYLFEQLQRRTLDHRLSDSYSCLGWFSPGQVFVLDEYCARYGVRGCHRHLYYLSDLLDRAETGIMIDPTLLHYSFAFCASHVHGNRPDGIGTITVDEKNKFEEIKDRLWNLLAHQITHFRYCFPFGRPEGALKATLSLFERVMMKDISTPVPPEEFRNEIRKCLQKAALVNYTRVSAYAQIEGISVRKKSSSRPHPCYCSIFKFRILHKENTGKRKDAPPDKRLDDIMHLAELCIDLLQQNEEHHAEALAWVADLMAEHQEIFWSLFSVDMDAALAVQLPDTWDSFQLFQLLNDYLSNEPSLQRGKFHLHLRETFAPLVIRYIDLMESSIAQSVHKDFAKETWIAVGEGCNSSEELFWKLGALQQFISDLNWPDEVMEAHLIKRLKLMSADMVESCIKRTKERLDKWLSTTKFSTDYVIPSTVFVMMNVITQAKKQSQILCAREESESEQHRYHSDVYEVLTGSQKDVAERIAEKLNSVLNALLHKLARYDHGSLLSSVFALKNPGNEMELNFTRFVKTNLSRVMKELSEERLKKYIVKKWYTSMVMRICEWLSHRMSDSLHEYQLKTLLPITKEIPVLFEHCGLPPKRLRCTTYGTVLSRLQVEEAMHKGEQIHLDEDYRGYSHSDDEDSDPTS
ncbi:predicted protein, partial [Nematostella vectensis]